MGVTEHWMISQATTQHTALEPNTTSVTTMTISCGHALFMQSYIHHIYTGTVCSETMATAPSACAALR